MPPICFSKLLFMLHECRRALEDRTPGLLEATAVRLEVIGFEATVPRADGLSSVTVAGEEDQKEETVDSASESSHAERMEKLGNQD